MKTECLNIGIQRFFTLSKKRFSLYRHLKINHSPILEKIDIAKGNEI
jgi:hypothetical protein